MTRAPASTQGAIECNKIGRDAGLTLNEQVFIGVEFALCFQHRQEIYEASPVLFRSKIDGQLALLDGLVQPIAAFLFLRIVNQGVLDLLEGAKDR